MDTTGQWQGEETGGGFDNDGDSLTGMAEDIFGLGVVLRLLMQFLDAGHLFSGLGYFDAVCQQNDAAIDDE